MYNLGGGGDFSDNHRIGMQKPWQFVWIISYVDCMLSVFGHLRRYVGPSHLSHQIKNLKLRSLL